MSTNPHVLPEELHPTLWRASQLARAAARCVDTGFPALSHQLPGGGWPVGALVDVMPQQAGIGEMRLLAPALVKVAQRQIVLLQPPHEPQTLALAGMGLGTSEVLWVRGKSGPDQLWAAETVLRSGSCAALLFWANHVRPEALRRLNLAAQAGETLFFMLRPIAAAQDASPAPLRLSLRPALGGVDVGFVKRRGPQRDDGLFIPLSGLGRAVVNRSVSAPRPAPASAPTPFTVT